jgi:hypothetical protein
MKIQKNQYNSGFDKDTSNSEGESASKWHPSLSLLKQCELIMLLIHRLGSLKYSFGFDINF